jgi:hypothetical protein
MIYLDTAGKGARREQREFHLTHESFPMTVRAPRRHGAIIGGAPLRFHQGVPYHQNAF